MADDKLKTESYALLGGINSKASPYLNNQNEFRDLTNFHFPVPGTLTKRYGTTLYTGATVTGRITSGVEFERLSGASYLVVTANTVAYTATNSNFSSFRTGLLDGGLFSFETFVDRLFAGNGQNFFKYDGSNAYNFSLPQGAAGFGVTHVPDTATGLSGIFVCSYGYINERGYFGPASSAFTLTLHGASFGSMQFLGLTAPSGYGITAIALYRSVAGSVIQNFATMIPLNSTGFSLNQTDTTLGTRLTNDNLFFTLAPKYLEIYNNQLFMAGFSSMLSTVYWSEVGEPEAINATFFSEFRTNDGDRVTGMKSYNGALIVTKERSVHRVTGDNPSNFLLQEISDQYGCLSHRTMVTWESYIWWLDTHGICEFDGSSVRIISDKVEPVFNSMSLAAARENACAIHFRKTNEIWFAVPSNGASINNTVVVYDYVSKAWTKYEGLNISALIMAKQSLSESSPFILGYTGTLAYYGESLTMDIGGAGITCMFKTPFYAPTGQTTERQYRRFYLDLNSVTGVTIPIEVRLMKNYESAVALSRTMYMQPFQSRIDFGVPAKAIQAQVIVQSASGPIQINGYTFESRYQRSV